MSISGIAAVIIAFANEITTDYVEIKDEKKSKQKPTMQEVADKAGKIAFGKKYEQMKDIVPNKSTSVLTQYGTCILKK